MDVSLTIKIKSVIKKYFTEGKADKLKTEGIEEIKTIIKRYGGFWKDYKNELNILINQVQYDLLKDFQQGHGSTIQNTLKAELNKIIQREQTIFSNNAKKAQAIIAKSLQESSINGKDWEPIVRRSLQKLNYEERHINTEIETTKAALNNLKRFKDFTGTEREDLHLRYEGPEPQRNFCSIHYNKIYKLEDIKEMTNDFGQPAFTYCGGYNCRHRWVPVFGKMEESNKLFIHESWQNKLENASKREKEIFLKEKDTAIQLSKLGYKTELNYELRKMYDKDTDIIVEGKYTQIKHPVIKSNRGIKNALNSQQADNIIIQLSNDIDTKEYNEIKSFINRHPEKKVFIFSIMKKQLREIK